MPATGVAALLFVVSAVLGVVALVRRSRRLGVLAAAVLAIFLVYAGLLFLTISRM